MAIDIGRIAYEAYIENDGNGNWPKELMAKWDDFGEVEQNAWTAAAVAVLQYIDKERELLSADNLELDLTKE